MNPVSYQDSMHRMRRLFAKASVRKKERFVLARHSRVRVTFSQSRQTYFIAFHLAWPKSKPRKFFPDLGTTLLSPERAPAYASAVTCQPSH